MGRLLSPATIGRGIPSGVLPGPKPNEVVIIRIKEAEVRVEVKFRRRITGPHVYQIVPNVRAREVDRSTAAIGEVARVVGVNLQGPDRITPRTGTRNHQSDNAADSYGSHRVNLVPHHCALAIAILM